MFREKAFWNLIAKKYSKDQIKDIKAYNHTLSLTKKHLNKKLKVLEIGCGTSSTAIKLASYVKSYTATDISSKMIEIGKDKVKKEKIKNIKLFDATLFDKKLKESSFDIVIAFNLIHLLDDRNKAIKRINSLLKKNGHFISKTPCLGEKKSMFYIASVMKLIIGPIRCFTLKELRESLKKNDFKIIKEHVYKKDNPPRTLLIGKK